MAGFALATILIISGLAIVGSFISYSRKPDLGTVVMANVLNVAVIVAAIYLAVN